MRMRLASAVSASLILLSVVVARAQPPRPDYSQEAFVIEQSKTTFRFEKDGTGRRDAYMRVKVQSAAGVQAFGQLLLGYNSANERIEIGFVRVNKPDGTVVVTPLDTIQDLSSPVERIAPVYTDLRQKHVTVQSLRPGDTLEFSVSTVVHTALAPGQFWTEYNFAKEQIVLDEQFDVDVPADVPVKIKTLPGFDAAIKDAGGRRVYHWAGSHLEREKPEDKEKKKPDPDEPERSAIRITSFQSWEDVGRWYATLEKTQKAPTPAIVAKARELTASSATDMEKLEALYTFVATNFRYVSLSLGLGRYQPRLAADVLRDQYGDCKDKHTLLASLIEASGMHASAVLINSAIKIDPDFPSPSQFDHVITRAIVGTEPVWLDATAEIAPFRMLAYPLRKKQALVIDAAKPRLEETPANPPVPNTVTQSIEGNVGDDGKLTARVTMTFRGDAELLLRAAFRATASADWKQILDQIVKREGVTGEVADWKVSDPAATKDPFRFEFSLSAGRFVDWTKKKVDISLPFSDISLVQADLSTEAEKRPLKLGPPGQIVYKLKLELPSAVRPHVPVPVTVARDYAGYRASYALTGQTFTAERRLDLRESELPADRRQDYAAFGRVVSSDTDQELSIESGTLANAAAPTDLKADDLGKSGYDAVQEGDYAKAVTLLKRAVELDPKNKWAWNNLGRAYFGQRNTAAAIAAFRKQIEVNPYDEYAYNSLGRAYVVARQYDEAETAYRKQLEVNPLDKNSHSYLGAMYLEQKKYEQAATEFEKAAAVLPDNAGVQVQLGKARLWLNDDAQASEAFARAVDLAPTPLTWNDIAYELSLRGVDLDRAQQYAESAVSATTAMARNLDVEHADAKSLAIVASLGAFWDTLGWVHFAKGDLETAERYVQAAWRLDQAAEVGDHLAQIYEKQGRRVEAKRMYALALAAERPSADVRTRLSNLVGADAVDPLVNENRSQLSAVRTATVAIKGGAGKHADFFVLFSAPSVVQAVKFEEGDDGMSAAADALRTAKFAAMFPDDAPAKILRRAMVVCPQSGEPCGVTLLLPQDTRPAK
jgi:tetratricopeptide (TPR) repeat protein